MSRADAPSTTNWATSMIPFTKYGSIFIVAVCNARIMQCNPAKVETAKGNETVD
jgi:hypothetical protein